MKLIEVLWVDSMVAPARWLDGDDIAKEHDVDERLQRAAGYVARESDEAVTICSARHEDSRAFTGCITIPASAITKRRTLR